MNTGINALESFERIQRELNYIKDCVVKLENNKLVLNERDSALLKMYHKLGETDQQIIYGLVTRFYDKEASF